MTTYTPEEWVVKLGRLASPEGTPPEEIMANHILSELGGYRQNSVARKDDIKQLFNAMEAFARLTIQYRVQP